MLELVVGLCDRRRVESIGLDDIGAGFKIRITPGTSPSGDGFSFNWATNVPNGTWTSAEEGVGDGLRVSFDTYDDGGQGLSFAILSFGSSEVMFSSGGQPSNQNRREVDLYVYVDNVDDLYRSLKDRVEIIKDLHKTFYGMREFIIRDVNRFWLTFAQFASTR